MMGFCSMLPLRTLFEGPGSNGSSIMTLGLKYAIKSIGTFDVRPQGMRQQTHTLIMPFEPQFYKVGPGGKYLPIYQKCLKFHANTRNLTKYCSAGPSLAHSPRASSWGTCWAQGRPGHLQATSGQPPGNLRATSGQPPGNLRAPPPRPPPGLPLAGPQTHARSHRAHLGTTNAPHHHARRICTNS